MSEIEVSSPPKLNGQLLADWLATALNHAGCNQSQLGREVGLQPVKINRIINGSREMSAVELLKFAIVLNAPLPVVQAPEVKAFDEPGTVRNASNAIDLGKKLTGLTGEALAEKLDMSAAHLSRLRNERRNLSAKHIRKLAEVCGVTEVEFYALLGGTSSAEQTEIKRAIRGAFEALEVAGKPITAASVSELAGLLYDLDDH